MTIEILYFEGCPNYSRAVDLVRDVLRELALEVDLREVQVADESEAAARSFSGSPTILVNGVDIEPAVTERTGYTFGCRLYGAVGVPPRHLILEALRQAVLL